MHDIGTCKENAAAQCSESFIFVTGLGMTKSKRFFFHKNLVHVPFHFSAFFKITDSLVLKMIRIQKLSNHNDTIC